MNRRTVRTLEMEREVLRKAAAFFARENESAAAVVHRLRGEAPE